MSTPQAPPADSSDLPRMHRVFRIALASAPDYVGTSPSDPARVELVASYYDNVLKLLDIHHDSEDTLITPLLLDRTSGDDADQIAAIARQHAPVHDALRAAQEKLAAWQQNAGPDTAAAATSALQHLDTLLTEHLDDEERVMVPLAAAHLNAAEWGAMPSHGMANFRGDKLWLILGLIQEQMTPEQIATMESHMPPPVAEMWNTTGRSSFTTFVADLRDAG